MVQTAGLRSIAGLAKTCPNDFVHLETGIDPLKDRFEKNIDIAYERYARLDTDDQSRRLMEKKVPERIQTRRGMRRDAEE